MPDEKRIDSLRSDHHLETEKNKIIPLRKRAYAQATCLDHVNQAPAKRHPANHSVDNAVPTTLLCDLEHDVCNAALARISTATATGALAISNFPGQKGLIGSAITNLSHVTPISFASPDAPFSPSPSFPFVDRTPRHAARDEVIDIDAADVGNALSQYWVAKDVAAMWLRRERTLETRADYLSTQPEVTGKMRAILVDWLVDVHLKFRLRAEVLHLAVSLVDRFLSVRQARRSRLQLIGVSAMLIAAKYEEICAPAVDEFVAITDSAFARREILAMEAAILNALGFRLNAPSALRFLQRDLKALRACNCGGVRLVAHLAQYCVELALMDDAMLAFPCSERAAAATLLAARALGEEGAWNSTIRHYTGGYDEKGLARCRAELVRLLEHEKDRKKINKLTALKRKFSARKYSAISKLAASIDLSALQ